MEELFYWGKDGQHGPYHAQDNGWPNAGEVMRDFRQQKAMSAQELGEVYGRTMHTDQQPVSARRIHQMEAENDVPSDIERRRTLASLLDIPPFLFGLAALEDVRKRSAGPEPVPPAKRPAPPAKQRMVVDLEEYSTFLTFGWAQFYHNTAHTLVSGMHKRIRTLETVAREVGGIQAEQAKNLLCPYHFLLIDIARDQCHYATAFNHVNSLLELAHEMDREDVLATALLRSGATNYGKGQYAAATFNLKQVLPLAEQARPQLKGYILQTAGLAFSHMATTEQEKTFALKKLDEAYNIIRAGPIEEDGSFVKLAPGWHYRNRAEALLAQQRPKDAQHVLKEAERSIGPEQPRRYIYVEISQIYIYIALGYLPIATTTALHVLEIAEVINSKRAVLGVADIYKRLRTSEYKNHVDVAELGLKLDQVKARLGMV
jgi:tetratricopeptide (TPR) repeat protein